MDKLRITTSAFLSIVKHLGSYHPERAGVLMGSVDDFVVTRFIYDFHSEDTPRSCKLNFSYLDGLMSHYSYKEDIHFLGIVHTHYPGFDRLSNADLILFGQEMKRYELEKMLVPICFPAASTDFRFIGLYMNNESQVFETELEIIPNR